MKQYRNYFIMLGDENRTIYYLFNSTARKGTTSNYLDCMRAVQTKTGKIIGRKDVNENSVYLDTPKNRDEQCFGEYDSIVIDCRQREETK